MLATSSTVVVGLKTSIASREEAVLRAFGQVVLEQAARIGAGDELLPVGHAVAVEVERAIRGVGVAEAKEVLPADGDAVVVAIEVQREDVSGAVAVAGDDRAARRGEERREAVGAERHAFAVRLDGHSADAGEPRLPIEEADAECRRAPAQ